ETTIALKISKSRGFEFEVTKNNKTVRKAIPNRGQNWDSKGLVAAALAIKQDNPEVLRIDMLPSKDVNLNESVGLMDQLRRTPNGEKVTFVDPKTNERIETELMFPNILFSNVVGD